MQTQFARYRFLAKSTVRLFDVDTQDHLRHALRLGLPPVNACFYGEARRAAASLNYTW